MLLQEHVIALLNPARCTLLRFSNPGLVHYLNGEGQHYLSVLFCWRNAQEYSSALAPIYLITHSTHKMAASTHQDPFWEATRGFTDSVLLYKDMWIINSGKPPASPLITGWLNTCILQTAFTEESLQLAQLWLSFLIPTNYLHSPFVNCKW